MAAVTPVVLADNVNLYFLDGSRMAGAARTVADGSATLTTALELLAAGPTVEEQARGLVSAIPEGTTVRQVLVNGTSVSIEFSADLLSRGLDELTVETVFRQVAWTLRPFGLNTDVRLTVDGQVLASYLPPVTRVVPPKPVSPEPPRIVGSLAGHSVTLSPGHGYMWNGSDWYTQRPVYCAPLNQEDMHNLEMCQYLENYLAADGMTVRLVRCTNKNYGTYAGAGKPWWQMAAYVWLKQIGYPCSVYANSSGDCTLGAGGSERDDDIRSRPAASDYDNSEIFVSLHTNGYTGDCTGSCPTGSETYYDASSEHAAWGAISQDLATHINDNIMSLITGNVDSSWTCHGTCVKNSDGNYGEIRIPNRAATLTELAFHDTCSRDADEYHLQENFFRSAAMYGMYKGICDYFGTPPTWGPYSDEYVSDTIPTTMTGGESYNVSITFRNRGLVWAANRNFRLGAVGDNDPFTSVLRFTPAVEVGPGQQYTFNLTLTPPETGGNYITDWQMVRENYAWFGAVCSKQVHVVPAFPPGDFDHDSDVDITDFGHMQACISGPTVQQNLEACQNARLDGDSDVDQGDVAIFLSCLSGPDIPAVPSCAN